jgi:hypothetical protein
MIVHVDGGGLELRFYLGLDVGQKSIADERNYEKEGTEGDERDGMVYTALLLLFEQVEEDDADGCYQADD